MHVTPDSIIFWQAGPLKINATLVFTWLVMAIMVVSSWLVTRRLSRGTSLSRGQNLLEILVGGIQGQIRDVTRQDSDRYLPFIGTLFMFVAVSNVLMIVPGFRPPTGSISTTIALALCVFVAVPAYGIADHGLKEYLKAYVRPSVLMLPMNVLGELTRTFALALRLFGNVMSGTMIGAILLAIAPLFVPVIANVLGLLVGLIQAYIFAILALVFIASANAAHEEARGSATTNASEEMIDG
ncbi:MAG: F0F1 ATP synthase subunit A [Burkholderiales bacterium]|nr:F0F1 ATP synthase subunit A [Burkholderiales bacterium]